MPPATSAMLIVENPWRARVRPRRTPTASGTAQPDDDRRAAADPPEVDRERQCASRRHQPRRPVEQPGQGLEPAARPVAEERPGEECHERDAGEDALPWPGEWPSPVRFPVGRPQGRDREEDGEEDAEADPAARSPTPPRNRESLPDSEDRTDTNPATALAALSTHAFRAAASHTSAARRLLPGTRRAPAAHPTARAISRRGTPAGERRRRPPRPGRARSRSPGKPTARGSLRRRRAPRGAPAHRPSPPVPRLPLRHGSLLGPQGQRQTAACFRPSRSVLSTGAEGASQVSTGPSTRAGPGRGDEEGSVPSCRPR